MKILIIDDNEEVSNSLKKMLSEQEVITMKELETQTREHLSRILEIDRFSNIDSETTNPTYGFNWSDDSSKIINFIEVMNKGVVGSGLGKSSLYRVLEEKINEASSKKIAVMGGRRLGLSHKTISHMVGNMIHRGIMCDQHKEPIGKNGSWPKPRTKKNKNFIK